MAGCEMCDGTRIVLAANTQWHPAGTVVLWQQAGTIINCPLCFGVFR